MLDINSLRLPILLAVLSAIGLSVVPHVQLNVAVVSGFECHCQLTMSKSSLGSAPAESSSSHSGSACMVGTVPGNSCNDARVSCLSSFSSDGMSC